MNNLLEASCAIDAIDLLAEACIYVRSRLKGTTSTVDRLRTLWAAVVAARDIGSGDVVETEFLNLAYETGLAADLGNHSHATLRHVIRWGMRGMNPFQ